MAMKAIKREFDIEKMLTSEIQQKSLMETKMLLEKKRREEKKRECLDKAFSAKAANAARLRQSKSALERLKNIKKEAQKAIAKKRAQMRNKIKDILKRNSRRNRQIETEIRSIRSNIAKKIIKAERKGSQAICVAGMDSTKKRMDYCKTQIVDSYIQFNDCTKEGMFGNICCENEFGNMYIEERDKCIAACDKKLNSALEGGEFI